MNPTDGTTVLTLDLPDGAFCGIDLLSFTTNPRFRGIKHIPVGWHFIFSGVNSAFSLRHGVWFEAKKAESNAPQIVIFKWDSTTEDLVLEQDESAILHWRANLGSIWRDGLTPYRQTASAASEDTSDAVKEEASDWPRLCDCVSLTVLSRITQTPPQRNAYGLTSASSARQDIEHIPGLTSDELSGHAGTELQFLNIDLKNTWRDGAVGRERSDAARDRSWALENMLKTQCKTLQEVIGELQITFLMVLTLNNNSCLEQWKRILGLLLTCDGAVSKRPKFFVHFLATLKFQLEHCADADGGLFDFGDEGQNLLKKLLGRFRTGLEQSGTDVSSVMSELEGVEKFLESAHGWQTNHQQVRKGTIQLEDGEEVFLDLGDEEDEYAPALVDVDPELAKQWRLQTGAARSGRNRSALEMANDRESSDDEMGSDDDPRY